MSDFKIDADKKGETLYVEHDNLLGEVKKRPDVKNLIKIKGFPASVEVSFAKPVDNPKKLFSAAEKAAAEFEKKVLETFESLVADVTQLQEDEKKKGDAKAADKADKRLKQATKDLKSLAGEFGTRIRKAVERELKALKEKDGKAPAGRSSAGWNWPTTPFREAFRTTTMTISIRRLSGIRRPW